MKTTEHSIELVGMMDSPFVRRVAIALTCYHLPYKHLPLSVYDAPEQLAVINPLLTVPVLRTADMQLIDSRLILDWIDAQIEQPWLQAYKPCDQSKVTTAWLQTAAVADVLALKAGELYRELGLRPMQLRSHIAADRLALQISAALLSLEEKIVQLDGNTQLNSRQTGSVLDKQLNHASIAVATSYAFVKMVGAALEVKLPLTSKLHAQCAAMETLQSFQLCDPN